jgi:hypothetical protein
MIEKASEYMENCVFHDMRAAAVWIMTIQALLFQTPPTTTNKWVIGAL